MSATRYGYKTTRGFNDTWYATLVHKRKHTYGKHTSFGRRTVWKECVWKELGRFASRELAIEAGKAAVAERKDAQ